MNSMNRSGFAMDVQCRVATIDELSKLQQFLTTHYLPNLEIFTSLGLPADAKEVQDYLYYSLQEGISQQTTVVATNQHGEIAGLSVNHGVEDEPKPHDIDMDAWEPSVLSGVKTMVAFTGDLQKDFQSLLPKPFKRVLLISMLSVDKSLGRQGIGRKLLHASAESAKKNGFDAAIALSVSIASQNLFRKLGYSVVKVIKHEDFVSEDGKRLINCRDGTEEGQLVFLSL